MSKTYVFPCVCPSQFQDATYGNKMRVYNEHPIKSGGKGARCTVCKADRTVQSAPEKKNSGK